MDFLCGNDCRRPGEVAARFVVAYRNKGRPPRCEVGRVKLYCHKCLCYLPWRDDGDAKSGRDWLLIPDGEDVDATLRRLYGEEVVIS